MFASRGSQGGAEASGGVGTGSEDTVRPVSPEGACPGGGSRLSRATEPQGDALHPCVCAHLRVHVRVFSCTLSRVANTHGIRRAGTEGAVASRASQAAGLHTPF